MSKLIKVERQTLKKPLLDHPTLQDYTREFGITNPNRVTKILGRTPDRNTITPIDFDKFRDDVEQKKQLL